jgi:type VI secretion system protein ImpF
VAGLTSQERLQPSLLDRLTDTDPTSSRESLEARVLSKQQLRSAVLRDLSWLFNTTRLQPDAVLAPPDEVRMWKEASFARTSVLNFGIPALSGKNISMLHFAAVENAVREAIMLFEPRIDPKTLVVEVNREAGSFNIQHNSLKLVIRGHMWNQPVPLELLLSADVDVETGLAAVRDLRA